MKKKRLISWEKNALVRLVYNTKSVHVHVFTSGCIGQEFIFYILILSYVGGSKLLSLLLHSSLILNLVVSFILIGSVK